MVPDWFMEMAAYSVKLKWHAARKSLRYSQCAHFDTVQGTQCVR
jgi:hypothetical protein